VGYGPDTSWRERFVVVDGARVDAWQRAGWVSDQEHSWSPVEAQAASAAHRLALASCANGSDDAIDSACLAIDQFIFACRPHSSAGADPIATVVSAWRNNPADADIAAGAMAANLSLSRFQARIVERYGLSPQRLIQAERIALACRELLLSADGLKSIARRCGYGSLETFVRAFGRETGSTPGQWRRQQRPDHP
jgi:AraC-like DNA-binding protein